MKPWKHAKSSAVKFGGKPEDYLEIHDFMDSSKAHVADVRHRALFHSSFGIYITEMVFGTNITNSDNKEVSVRDIAEQHVIEDLGFIPSVEKWLSGMPIEEWMGGVTRKLMKEAEDVKKSAEPEKEESSISDIMKKIAEIESDRKKDKTCPDDYPNPYSPPRVPYPWPYTKPEIWPYPKIEPWIVTD